MERKRWLSARTRMASSGSSCCPQERTKCRQARLTSNPCIKPIFTYMSPRRFGFNCTLNWQLDGISVSDVQGSGSISGGIPIPNPDMLEEFKVQTGLYDAAFGRAAGASVSVITKTGTTQYHGTIFEFLRNDVLNANDFFL